MRKIEYKFVDVSFGVQYTFSHVVFLTWLKRWLKTVEIKVRDEEAYALKLSSFYPDLPIDLRTERDKSFNLLSWGGYLLYNAMITRKG